MGSAIFHTAVSLLVLLIAQVVLKHSVTFSVLFFPVVLFPLILISMGVAWMLAAIGVFVRDIGQITVVLTTVLLFLSPVFYPITAMPERYRPWIEANPLTFFIEQSRVVLILSGTPDWLRLGKYTLLGMLVAVIGYWVFQRMRRGFADVL